MKDSTVLTIKLNARAYRTLRSMHVKHALVSCLKDHNKYMRYYIQYIGWSHMLLKHTGKFPSLSPDACIILAQLWAVTHAFKFYSPANLWILSIM